ncbi:MAG: hypothetical protein NVS2B12_04240 [Ktedonobacteraceae bacterium]
MLRVQYRASWARDRLCLRPPCSSVRVESNQILVTLRNSISLRYLRLHNLSHPSFRNPSRLRASCV